MKKIIEARNLEKKFGVVTALKKISFEIEQGK